MPPRRPPLAPKLLETHQRRSGHWETVWRGPDGRMIRLLVPEGEMSEETLARLERWLGRPERSP